MGPRAGPQPAVGQVCTAACRGRSDGRLDGDDVCAFDQVLVLPVDQRVPLVEVLVQACETRKHNSEANSHNLPHFFPLLFALYYCCKYANYPNVGLNAFYSTPHLPALTQVALQEGQRRPVAKVHGQFGVDLPLQFHQLPDPVPSQEGEVWEALVHRASEVRKRNGGRVGR